MTPADVAAIQARVAAMLPIGYVLRALRAAHTPEEIYVLTRVLYEDTPRLLAEVARLQANEAEGRAFFSLYLEDEPPPGGWRTAFGLPPDEES